MIFQPPSPSPFRLLFFPQGVALNRLGIQPTFCFSLLPLSFLFSMFFLPLCPSSSPSVFLLPSRYNNEAEKRMKELRVHQHYHRPSSTYMYVRTHIRAYTGWWNSRKRRIKVLRTRLLVEERRFKESTRYMCTLFPRYELPLTTFY